MAHTDDRTIADSAKLWRRIHPTWIFYDDNLKRKRPSSAAFDDSKDGTPMSVQLAEIVIESGSNAQKELAGYDGYALAEFTAGFARNECRQGIEPNPTANDPAHAYVFGQKTEGTKKKFARNAAWVVAPPETTDP